MWPFGRKKHRQQPIIGRGGVTYDEDGTPLSFPIENTDYDDIVTGILERARNKAADLDPGTEFSVEISEDEQRSIEHPLLLMGPVMMRAQEYGLMPGAFRNESYTFTKF